MTLTAAARPCLRLAPAGGDRGRAPGGGAEVGGAAGGPALALGRAHEVWGPARRFFAALAAGAAEGPVLWVRGWPGAEALNPEGLAAALDPARLVLAAAPGGIEALWAAEEALRSGAAPVVVVEPRAPPGLTPVRRLQLAAEAGAEVAAARGGPAPLCLILTPEGGCAAAVETRWRADPLPGWASAGGPARGGGPGRWTADAPSGWAQDAPSGAPAGGGPARWRGDHGGPAQDVGRGPAGDAPCGGGPAALRAEPGGWASGAPSGLPAGGRARWRGDRGGPAQDVGRGPAGDAPCGGGPAALRADALPGWAQDAPSGAPAGGGPARWRFTLLRDKAGPPAAWEVAATALRDWRPAPIGPGSLDADTAATGPGAPA